MSENKFWAIVWGLGASIVISIIVAATVADMNFANKLAASNNPLELSCSLQGTSYSLIQSCVTLQSMKKEKTNAP